VDPVVDDALAAIRRRDWDALRPLLHPYLHWTGADGRTVRGRVRVLALLADHPPTGRPVRHELRDGQVYRWVEGRDP
jgi:hypothetical protein